MKDHAAFIVRSGNQIIFIQRAATKKILPNIWALPSGTIEEGEKATETAVREAQEELGITVKPEILLGVMESPEFNARIHFVVCTLISGNPAIRALDEIRSLRLMTFQEFFNEYDDSKIGHGLIYLRNHPELWQAYFS